ncbi:MAG: transposase family protein [Planctomycetaceae bacterium]|nr:transposase family protein [Planctomycetaceae bacterium]
MPQRLLYHILGVHGYQLDQIFSEDHQLICVISQSRESLCCSHCNPKRLISQGKVTRRFKTVPLGSQQIEIEFAIPRVRCRACHLVRQVKIPFAKSKKRYTKLFEQYALGLLRFATTLYAFAYLFAC